jgi:HrpA-like RNA helicase
LRLPIDPLIPEILNHLRAAENLILEAPPGAGKTTRVPPALLDRMRQRNYRVDRGGSLDYLRAAAQAVGVSPASR